MISEYMYALYRQSQRNLCAILPIPIFVTQLELIETTLNIGTDTNCTKMPLNVVRSVKVRTLGFLMTKITSAKLMSDYGQEDLVAFSFVPVSTTRTCGLAHLWSSNGKTSDQSSNMFVTTIMSYLILRYVGSVVHCNCLDGKCATETSRVPPLLPRLHSANPRVFGIRCLTCCRFHTFTRQLLLHL